MSAPQPDTRVEPWKQILRGIGMGAADVVPGVSGGTIAFLTGIYPRLIHAISHFDRTWIELIWKRQFRAAIKHADLWFLASLATGILTGILLTAVTVHELLSATSTRPYTLAFFFGVIFASGKLIYDSAIEQFGKWSVPQWLAAFISILLAGWLALMPPPADPAGSPAFWFVFLGGSIAICAMLLPGISGAMILLLLGLYGHMTGIPHALKEGKEVTHNLIMLIVFGCGCATGLAVFSRFLRWLLDHHAALTMSILCGLMFGSLPRLWPFQYDATPEVADFEDKQLSPILPESYGWETWSVILTMLLSAAAILLIHHFATSFSKAKPAVE